MENVTSIAAKQPGIAFPSLRCIPKMAARRLISGAENRGIRVSAGCIRAQQAEYKEGSALASPLSNTEENALKVKEWEVGQFQEEIAATQGIRIRRRPPTGPPLHYVGPFEFRLQNEGNTPRNILEEIIWHKDTEVSRVLSQSFLLLVPIFIIMCSCNDNYSFNLDEGEAALIFTEESS